MGIRLYPIANHELNISKSNIEEQAIIIQNELSNLDIKNIAELRTLQLCLEKGDYSNPRYVRRIRIKEDWSHSLYPNLKYLTIDFEGPHCLSFRVDPYRIIFYSPTYKYYNWFNSASNEIINEWRKFFSQIGKLFGSDKVIYLADSHPFETYIYDDWMFDEIIQDLKLKYGNPCESMSSTKNSLKTNQFAYYIDYLENIDWSKSIDLELYGEEPIESVDVSFDLKKFQNYKDFRGLKVDDEYLAHRLNDGNSQVEFFHVFRHKGLLCYNSGSIGRDIELQTTLDRLAPFTFDEQVQKLKTKGFNATLMEYYDLEMNIKPVDSIRLINIINQFKFELIWNGLGTAGGEFSNPNGLRRYHFRTIDIDASAKIIESLINDSGISVEYSISKNKTMKSIY